MKFLKSIFFLSILSAILSSCASHKDMILFRKGDEKTLTVPPKQDISSQQIEIKLQFNDIIAVAVTGLNQELIAPYSFGTPQMAAQAAMTPVAPTSFIVPKNGEIDFPNVGTINVIGFSLTQLRDSLKSRISTMMENPSVNVRLVNFKVNVVGEVMRPGVVQIENEQITILEAIARVGDFTPYADRERVRIVREQNGVREQAILNFKNMDIFQSPYYYLRQNDMIYIEPKNTRIAQIEQPINRYLIPAQTTISFVSLLIALFR